MTKTVIAVKGPGRRGKSSTIKLLYEEVKKEYPKAVFFEEKVTEKEVFSIIETPFGNIGIESQGDPGSRQGSGLKTFVENGCALIICATRTSGETAKAIAKLKHEHGYDIIWTSNYRNFTKNEVKLKELNKTTAKHLILLVRDIFENTFY